MKVWDENPEKAKADTGWKTRSEYEAWAQRVCMTLANRAK